MKGTCSRYSEYLRFYADLIDSDSERRERKCKNCPTINKKKNVIFIDGDCRYHLLKELSTIVSYSSVLIVPDLNLIKYSMHEIVERGLDLVDEYEPLMNDDDFRSIHVFKRAYKKEWTISLPLWFCLLLKWFGIRCVYYWDLTR